MAAVGPCGRNHSAHGRQEGERMSEVDKCVVGYMDKLNTAIWDITAS